MPAINVPDHVDDEAAYIAAANRRIKENARKGRAARWLAEDPTRADLVKFIDAAADRDSFMRKMFESLEEWGSLTAGQEAAVRKCMAQAEARKAERIAKDSISQHVGEIGKRGEFELTVRAVKFDAEGMFGPTYFVLMADAAENIFVYSGGSFGGNNLAAGNVVKIKATVKKHHVSRDGIRQTYLARPAFI